MAERLQHSPLVLKADEGPLNVEHVVADDVGLAVLHQELEIVAGLLDAALVQHIANQTQIDVRWEDRHSHFRFFK